MHREVRESRLECERRHNKMQDSKHEAYLPRAISVPCKTWNHRPISHCTVVEPIQVARLEILYILYGHDRLFVIVYVPDVCVGYHRGAMYNVMKDVMVVSVDNKKKWRSKFFCADTKRT